MGSGENERGFAYTPELGDAGASQLHAWRRKAEGRENKLPRAVGAPSSEVLKAADGVLGIRFGLELDYL